MATERMLNALNDQIQKEFFSEYLYISMEAYFAENDLDGFANFFNVQAREERDHSYKFFNYVNRAGGKVLLQAIEQPKFDFTSPLDVFEYALSHEKEVTKSIHNLVDLSLEDRDHATTSFLNWFVDEQAEEEESMNKIVKKLKLLKDNPAGLFMLDQELAQRVYVAPTQA